MAPRGSAATEADRSLRREIEQHLDEVRAFAEDLPEAFLHCREMGHSWAPYTASLHKDGGYERTLLCRRCDTRRLQGLDRRGLVVRSRYVHPEGYLSKGLGHLAGEDRGVLRIASIRRRFDEGSSS